MSVAYSHLLIEDTIKCFLEEDNIVITQEQAIEYLDSTSRLFLVLGEDCNDSVNATGL